MKTLKQILQENNKTTLNEAKTWLLEKTLKLKNNFDDRVITERTIVSSKLLGWQKGNQVLDGLEILATQNTTIARLLRLVKTCGVDVNDDPTIVDQLKVILQNLNIEINDNEVSKLKNYAYNEISNYILYAPKSQMPTDQEIINALK